MQTNKLNKETNVNPSLGFPGVCEKRNIHACMEECEADDIDHD